MFETILGIVLPVVKDLLWTACGALLAYAINKIQSHFSNVF
jgi:hypothetical protein